jgi:hypothetical protein
MARNYVNTGDLKKAKEFAQRIVNDYPNASETGDTRSILSVEDKKSGR